MTFKWTALSAVAVLGTSVLSANYGGYDNYYDNNTYYPSYPNSYVEEYQGGYGYQGGQQHFQNQPANPYGANQQQYPSSNYQGGQQFQQQGQLVNADRDLLNRIQGLLSNNSFQNVVIRVNNGTVTLTGFVENDQIRQDLKDKISNLNGVKSINDKLEIRIGFQKPQDQLSYNSYSANDASDNANMSNPNASNANDADFQLKRRVMDALKKGFFSKRFSNIQIDVQNGVVTLKGTVDTEIDTKRAEEQAKKVDGVRDVNNQLKIQYTRSGT